MLNNGIHHSEDTGNQGNAKDEIGQRDVRNAADYEYPQDTVNACFDHDPGQQG
jgi:hypothetical protein